MSANPVPTTREELTFKVVETYERILDDCVGGVITLAQADYAIKTLIAATGWCVERSVFLMLSDWKTEPDESFLERRVFIKGLDYYSVIKVPYQSAVAIYHRDTPIRVIGCQTTSELGDLFNKVCQQVQTKYDCREITWPKRRSKK